MPGIWWQIVEKYKVNVMFSAPTAARVLKKQDPAFMHKYDLSSLKHLRLASRSTSRPTSGSRTNSKPVIDNYWQTETGWPMLAALPGVERPRSSSVRRASRFMAQHNLQIFRETVPSVGPTKGYRRRDPAVAAWLPVDGLGWMTDSSSPTFTLFKDPLVYSSYDWAIKDEDGYFTILGRTDDVINVAGHRLGT